MSKIDYEEIRARDGALLSTPEVGRATSCAHTMDHRPRPLRFVWHHVLPATAGGETNTSNLLSLCDNDHYAIHELLWYMVVHGGMLPPLWQVGSDFQRGVARQGFELAYAAGTVNKIPNEGGILL